MPIKHTEREINRQSAKVFFIYENLYTLFLNLLNWVLRSFMGLVSGCLSHFGSGCLSFIGEPIRDCRSQALVGCEERFIFCCLLLLFCAFIGTRRCPSVGMLHKQHLQYLSTAFCDFTLSLSLSEGIKLASSFPLFYNRLVLFWALLLFWWLVLFLISISLGLLALLVFYVQLEQWQSPSHRPYPQ